MDVNNNKFLSIEQMQGVYSNRSKQVNVSSVKVEDAFKDILTKKAIELENRSDNTQLKFSKHAVGRLATRNIELSGSQLERLKEGSVRAGDKGIKESLVIVDQLAFIVNVPNNTVITAIDSGEDMEKVFTNIDGAVII